MISSLTYCRGFRIRERRPRDLVLGVMTVAKVRGMWER